VAAVAAAGKAGTPSPKRRLHQNGKQKKRTAERHGKNGDHGHCRKHIAHEASPRLVRSEKRKTSRVPALAAMSAQLILRNAG